MKPDNILTATITKVIIMGRCDEAWGGGGERERERIEHDISGNKCIDH